MKQRFGYAALLGGVFLLAVWASWRYGGQLDNIAYDGFFRTYRPQPWQTQSVILGIDEATLAAYGGMANIRRPMAQALRLIDAAGPKVVAIDLILTDPRDSGADRELAEAFQHTPNLVLSSILLENPPGWEEPRPEFARWAAAKAHVAAQPDDRDLVTRSIPLDKNDHHEQRWALALEAFRLSRGGGVPLETPGDVEVAGTVIPFQRTDDGRLMRVRFLPPDRPIEQISLKGLLDHPDQAAGFKDKVVFAGVTAPTEARERYLTPYAFGVTTTGVEIHAAAFETLAQGLFLTDAPASWPPLIALLLVIAAGLAFVYLPGWKAYAAGALVTVASLTVPYAFFTHRVVFSTVTPGLAAVLAVATAAAWQTLVVRRSLRRAEAERVRYQQAMHFVTHEMRTPLSAIQGSSELISRFALTEEKRKQLALLINSESKRVARMIEIFLNVERLSAGQMELKREDIPLKPMLETCLERARPLAERKNIGVTLEPVSDDLHLTGDRELMEHACYNLLTNAVKYSPHRTQVNVSVWRDDGQIRVAVKDQGIGMDQKEVKKIFQRFYRTKKAEESGEAGTGIGLSIVQQIVEQHQGRIEVSSRPGVGSCFTLVVPAAPVPAPQP